MLPKLHSLHQSCRSLSLFLSVHPVYQKKIIMHINYQSLLYKHQWNTGWAFAQKHDLFTWENNMLSSHMKYHCCYGYIITHAFHSKQLFQWNALVFRVEKIFLLFAALTCEISWLSTLKEKFCIMISVQPCNILYISKNSQSVISQKYQLFILKQAGEGSSITDS